MIINKNYKQLAIFTCLLACLRLTSYGQSYGTQKWAYNAGVPITSSAAAIDMNQVIYFANWQHTMYALNPNNTVKWTASAGSEFLGESSPALSADGSVVYYSVVGSTSPGGNALVAGGITARSTADGHELWHFYIDASHEYFNPPIARMALGADGTIYFVAPDFKLYALTSAGVVNWSVLPGSGASISTSPAIGSDGTIYVGGDAGRLYGYTPGGVLKSTFITDGGAVCSPAFGVDGTIYVGGYGGLYAFAPDGTRKWKFTNTEIQAQFPDSGPSIGKDGVIYFDSVGGNLSYLYAVNPDGTQKWQFPTGESQSDASFSSPAVVSDGTIYVGSSTGGKIYAVNANGSSRWTFSTTGKVFSPVAVGSDGTVYVGSLDGKFYAIYGSAPLEQQSPWPKFSRDSFNGGAADPSVNSSITLSGDVTGISSATVVASVGGQTAANVASGASAANAATSANTPNTIVKRDGFGNFSAGAISLASTLTTGGNVGVNTASPNYSLDVTGNSWITAQLTGTDQNRAALLFSSMSRGIQYEMGTDADFSGDHNFYIYDSAEGVLAMEIDSNHNTSFANNVTIPGSLSSDSGGFYSDGAGNMTAQSFAGDGSRLINLNPANINFGTGGFTIAGPLVATNLGNVISGSINPTNILPVSSLPVYSYVLATNWVSPTLSNSIVNTPIVMAIPSGTYQIQYTVPVTNGSSSASIGAGYALSGNATSISEIESSGQASGNMAGTVTVSAISSSYLQSNIRYVSASALKSPLFSYSGLLTVTNNCTYTVTVGVAGTDKVTVYKGSGVVLTRIQ